MEITAGVAADLTLLADALRDPTTNVAPDLADTVLVLAANARAAVSSLLGLTVTATRAAHETGAEDRVVLRFTLLDEHVEPADVASSLRLPRPTAGAAPDQPSIAVVLHAATPGAFVDLAADLAFMTGRGLATGDLDQHLGSAWDPDVTGILHAEPTISGAVGVLIDRGRTHEQAHAELDTLADAAHTDRVTEATRILTSLAGDEPDVPTLGALRGDLT